MTLMTLPGPPTMALMAPPLHLGLAAHAVHRGLCELRRGGPVIAWEGDRKNIHITAEEAQS